jgi:nucleoside-diphosphate-sugar epimerase
MSKKIFITGGLGYIGSVLAREAVSRGFNVTIYDALIYEQPRMLIMGQIHQDSWSSTVKLIVGDTRNKELLEYSLIEEKPDFVFHLAELSSVYACEHNPPYTEDMNYSGSKNVIDLCAKYSIPTLYNSSSSVYGYQKESRPMTEVDFIPNPSDRYCKYKLMMENYIKEVKDKSPDFKVLIFRPATVGGVSPRIRLELLPNHFTYCAVAKGNLRVAEPESHRAIIDVEDLVKGYLNVLDKGVWKSTIYNIGNFNYTKITYAKRISSVVPCNVILDQSISDLRNVQIDCSLFNNEFNFKPSKSFETSTLEIADWLKSHLQEIEKNNFNGFLNMSLDVWRKIT